MRFERGMDVADNQGTWKQMDIRFTSSLTPDDENAVAPALLVALSKILDLLPIAYMIRIDTSDSKTFQHIGRTDTAGNAPAPPASIRPHRGTRRSDTNH